MAKMAVVATKVGYYGNKRRKEGEKFQVEEDHFSKKWMERLTGSESKAVVEQDADDAADKAKGKGKKKSGKDDDSVI